jgi:hypothetical protein
MVDSGYLTQFEIGHRLGAWSATADEVGSGWSDIDEVLTRGERLVCRDVCLDQIPVCFPSNEAGLFTVHSESDSGER